MRSVKERNQHSRTTFIRLDTKKCTACWKCQDQCSNKVIGKVNFPWHKHAHIVKAVNCDGCLKCVKVCQSGALSGIMIKKQNDVIQ